MSGSLEELPAQMLQLRELLTEGHGLVKDLDRLLREARELRRSLPDAVNERIEKAVDKGLTEYKDTLGKAIEDATSAVYDRFDTITMLLLGEDPKSVREGKATIPDLIRGYIESKGLPYRLVPTGEGT